MLSAPSCPGSATVRRGWVSEAGGELGPPASTHTAGETPVLSRAWPYPEAEDRLQARRRVATSWIVPYFLSVEARGAQYLMSMMTV